MTLATNLEFAKAWTRLIHHWIVHRDDSHVILQLELNVLTCTYNTSKHADFCEYYHSLHTHYTLLLYKQWHEHFSFEEIKDMCDVMTDYGIKTQHAAKFTEKGLTIPDLVCEQRRMVQLLQGVKGSHLNDAAGLFKTLHPDLSKERMLELKRYLIQADTESTPRKSATLQYTTQGSSNPTSDEDKCQMCLYLKNDTPEIGFTNIKGHRTGTPCPPGNMAIMATWFGLNPHISGKRQHKPAKGPWTKSPGYGDSRGYNPNVPPANPRSQPSASSLQPPSGFDHGKNCIHCWKSMTHGGRDATTRGREWENHSSEKCQHTVRANPPYQAHSSQLVVPAHKQRDDSERASGRGRERSRKDERDRGPIQHAGYEFAAHTTTERSRSRSRGDTPPRSNKVTRLDTPPRSRNTDRDRDFREYSQERQDRDDYR
jgi:hypothetical protein